MGKMINYGGFSRIASLCVGFHLGTLRGYSLLRPEKVIHHQPIRFAGVLLQDVHLEHRIVSLLGSTLTKVNSIVNGFMIIPFTNPHMIFPKFDLKAGRHDSMRS